jgi:crotonobetainyl-CoA:carnitine CoA-transferase CaiB-like acyl-CoA transferase
VEWVRPELVAEVKNLTWLNDLQSIIEQDQGLSTLPCHLTCFDGVPTKVEPAPLLGVHSTEVLSDWLGLDTAAVARLKQDGIV